MSPIEELELILSLIRKYELPLSPILEYAVNEKKEEFQVEKPIGLSSAESHAETSTSSTSKPMSQCNDKQEIENVVLKSERDTIRQRTRHRRHARHRCGMAVDREKRIYQRKTQL